MVVLSNQDIDKLVEEGESIMPPSGFGRLKSIGRKAGKELIHDKMTNLQIMWDHWKQTMETDKRFRDQLRKGQWEGRNMYPDVILEYIRYSKSWEDYEHLSSRAWDELYRFATYTFAGYGIPTFGAIRPLIAADGNYRKYLSQWDFSHVDKDILKASETLRANFENMLKGLDPAQRISVGNLFSQYAQSPEGINKQEFHNLYFKTL